MRLTITAVLATVLLAPAAFAQDRFFDLNLNAVWLDPTGGGSIDELQDPLEIDVDSELGYGASANVFFSDRVSIEFAVSRVEPGTETRGRIAGPAPTGDLEIMPVTAVVQFHFIPNGFIDPYVGAGAAYVLYDFSPSDAITNIDEIEFEDDIGLAVNAGIGLRISRGFGLNFDAKYVPTESNATATVIGSNDEVEATFDVSPIILSAGISLRF
jgi:outer membrane protein